MKTEKQNEPISPIKQLREIRDKISLDIRDMNADQMKKYFAEQSVLHGSLEWGSAK